MPYNDNPKRPMVTSTVDPDEIAAAEARHAADKARQEAERQEARDKAEALTASDSVDAVLAAGAVIRKNNRAY